MKCYPCPDRTLATASAEPTTSNAQPTTASSPKKTYTAEEKRVCSIEAMKRGEECEACQ